MIKAFVGHSFLREDKETTDNFKGYFDSLIKTMPFEWDDAQEKEVKTLSEKVKKKMNGKNLFIGIFTRKHIEIEESKLIRHKFFNKDKFNVMKTDCGWGVSDWIIQESGYAIGTGMKTLFLIERGAKELQGLHSDMEHIYFTRGKESDCFSELNEALGNFLSEIKGKETKPKTEESTTKSKEVTAIEEKVNLEIVETEQEKSEEEYFSILYFFLLEKDETKFESTKQEILNKFRDNEEKIIDWQGKFLYLEGLLSKNNVLEQLKELVKKKPDNPRLHDYIASELEKYKDYGGAAVEYLNSAKYENNRNVQLLRIGSASEAYAKNKQKEEALDILLKEFREGLSNEEQYLIYLYLSNTAKVIKDDKLFVVFAEKALALNPSNDSLRFDLAYKYDDKLEKNEFALYHYKILVNSNLTSANLNNIGVSYSKLEMMGQAVNFYKKASKKDSSISMANLAQKLLDQGFIEEANDQLQAAMKIENYEKEDVGRALARIDSIIKQEQEKETKALESIEAEKQFKLEYADAFATPFIMTEDIEGNWTTAHGELDLAVESGNLLKAEKEEFIPETQPGFLGLALLGMETSALGGKIQLKESARKRKIIFNGRIIRNRSIEYTIEITEDSPKRTLLETTPKITGIGIINKAINIIKVMETDKDRKTSFYEFVRKRLKGG